MSETENNTKAVFPLKIYWKVVVGPEFNPIQNIQCFDYILDLQDLKERKMYLDTENNPQFINQMDEILKHGKQRISTNRTID